MKSRGNSMMKTLRISFSLKNTYRINSIYYGFKQIPVIKKILPESLYAAGGFKLVVSILSVIWEIISGFIGKFIYIFFMIFMVSALFSKTPQREAFVNILFFLTFIGALLNTFIFDPSKDKYYAVVLLRIDAREFAIVNYAYELCKILIGFLVFGLIFGLLSNVPVYVMLIVPLFVVCAKLTVSAFILWSYENHNHGKIKINVSENRLGSFKVILVILFLTAAYGLPALGFCPPVSVLFVLMLVVIVIGVFSCRRIVTFDKYRIVYGQILKDMDSMVEFAKNMDVDKNRKLISAEKESLELNSRIEKKKGFEYLNAVFINRHKRLLWKPVKRVCAICILLVAAGISAMLYLDDPGFRKDMAELLLKNLGMSTFWMYLINRGMGYTQALFMNCDHSLLCYPFYRKPKAVLELFTIRLREIIKINLPPALILGAGLSAMLFISHGTQNPLNYLILFLVFPAESVFFSVHYLVIYYMLQPYNAGTEIKSGMYKVITGLTYMACYMTIQLRMSTLKFGGIMITFSVVYCVVACVLAYRIAPRTFKIRE